MHMKNERQLRECFEKYSDALYRLCLFRLHGDDLGAADIMQESFYRAGVELAKWREIDNLKSFVFRIATNLIIDLSRKKKTESLDEKTEEDWYIPEATQISPEGQAHAQIELERLYTLLDEIPTEDRDLFLLRYVEELSPKEIAELLGEDTNALTVRLHRIKKRVSDSFNYSV